MDPGMYSISSIDLPKVNYIKVELSFEIEDNKKYFTDDKANIVKSNVTDFKENDIIKLEIHPLNKFIFINNKSFYGNVFIGDKKVYIDEQEYHNGPVFNGY
jgi:hypothetical protein